MGLLDGLGGVLQAATSQHPGGLSGVLNDAFNEIGGLDGVVSKLNDAGLGSKVNSWLGKGANVPLTADEVRAALSDEHVQQIAAKLGIPASAVPEVLAQHLPAAVDAASPNGKIGGIAAGVGGGAA